jgi:flagellar biosynthesis regulator FlaF
MRFIHLKCLPFVLLAVFSCSLISDRLYAQKVALNEIMASNNSILANEDGHYEDWIEIVNYGDVPVNLTGYGLSDDYDNPFRWVFPEITIQPGEFLLVWASNKDRTNPSSTLHMNFAISSSGEEILLSNPDGTRVDELPPIEIPTDMSIGRQPDGTGDWVYFDEPTPGTANTTQSISGLLEPPVLSHSPGFYSEAFELEITHPEEGVTIYYTLDGSTPTKSSLVYREPIPIYDRTSEPNVLSIIPTNYLDERRGFLPPISLIPKGTVIRILSVKAGSIPHLSAQSYFVFPEGAHKHVLPVISVITENENLFGHETGIYVPGATYKEGDNNTGNYYQRGPEWEREAAFEFFDENGDLGFSQIVGLRVHGGYSRRFSHKSFRVYARSEYGESRINYPVFPDQPYDSYNRLVLRNSGNDQGYTMLRDGVVHQLVEHLNFDTQAYRPAVVYINGEYWGIHNIREHYDRHYLGRVYGVDPDKIDLLTGNMAVVEGTESHYRNLHQFIISNEMARDHNFEYVKTRMDIDNYLDYYAAQVFFANSDWPHNNIDYWRLRTSSNPDAPAGHDGRWRWLFYDIDVTFWLVDPPTFNMLAWITNETGYLGSRWPNQLFRSLLENESFKYDFINRMADHMNSTFKPERSVNLLNSAAAVIESEIPEYINRWNFPERFSQWNNYIQQIRDFINQRPVLLRQNIIDHFGLSSTSEISVNTSNPEQTIIRVNSLIISPDTPGIPENPFPWTGIYFSGVPVTLHADSYEGIEHQYWLVNDTRIYKQTITVDPDTVATATAFFEGRMLTEIDPYPITSGTYYFDQWAIDAGEGTYPPHMAFVFMDQADPGLDARVVGMTFGEYGLDSRTRIEGLGDEGIGFINTASAEGNPGYPGTRLGGAVLVLDTRGVDGVQVGFEAGTVRPNSRVYHLRLQYRLGSEGSFSDVLDGEGNPVEYRRSEMQGYSEFIGPVALPEEAIGQPRVELLWRYYHSGEQVDESSGQRTMISLSAIHVAEPVDGLLPAAHVLTNTPYEFSNWTADSPPGSAPPSMGFVYMDRYDPGLDAGILGFTSGAFDLDARTRVEGLGEDGFALINTASLAGNPGYPGRRLGGAVLNLNTEGQGSVTVEWTGGTVRPNFRVYHLRLQYRTSVDEPFRDVVDATGEPVEYRRFEVGGHRQRLGPVTLPGDAGDQPWVQLLWRYYYTGEREEQESGQRAMLHIASIRVYSYALLGGEPGMPAEFRLYQNYPNPFYPQTTIRFDLPRDQHVRIDLFTITGRRVATLEDAPLRAGRHSVQVDASALASGVYLYRLHSEEFTETGKLSVIK